MRHVFCPKCGARLESRILGDEGSVPWCVPCDRPWFDTFSTCIITLVVNGENEALLLRQDRINASARTLVSGYVKPGETAEETARREVLEETGIRVDSLEFAGTYALPARDMLMIGFFASAVKGEFTLSSEIDGAEWVPLEQALPLMPKRQVSTARRLVTLYLERLQNGA